MLKMRLCHKSRERAHQTQLEGTEDGVGVKVGILGTEWWPVKLEVHVA